MILVDAHGVSVRLPERALFEELSVTVSSGDRVGVVGRNGSGKTTLLRVLAGDVAPDEGVVRHGRALRTGFLGQHVELPDGTVGDVVGRHWEAAAILERLGMGPLADAPVDTLSGGQAKRVALARVLVDEVDLLVLDEPTNHLDLDAVEWLENRVARHRGGLLLVTHDRHLLDRLATRVLELDAGRGYVHEGGYSTYLAARAERAEREATAEAVRRNLARAELAWLRRGAPARTRKPKARIAAATAVVEGSPPAPRHASPLDLTSAKRGGATPRLGDKVVRLEGVGHGFGGEWLFRGLDLELEPDGRLGVVGPNGAGKSTLLDVLAGRLVPAEGTRHGGPTVRLAHHDQTGRDLDLDQRVREAVAGDAGEPSWEQARLMERFWFDADAQRAPVRTLSGGERRRLQLLLVLAQLPNVLLLDEPTNDLDLDTLRALEDHLEHWPGSLVVVSHDRALLERVVEDVVVLDGRGTARVAPGGYAGYEAERRSGGAGGARALRGAGAGGAGAGGGTVPSRGGAGEASAGKGMTASPGGARDGGHGRGAAAGRKRRSPSTLQRLLALAERDMAGLAEERDRLAAELAGLGGDHVALERTANALADVDARLAVAEERWLALAEELGG